MYNHKLICLGSKNKLIVEQLSSKQDPEIYHSNEKPNNDKINS